MLCLLAQVARGAPIVARLVFLILITMFRNTTHPIFVNIAEALTMRDLIITTITFTFTITISLFLLFFF